MYDRAYTSKFKLLIAVFLLFTIVFSFSACTSSKEDLLMDNTERMLDALMSKDEMTVKELLIKNYADDEIELMYMDLISSFGEVNQYKVIDCRYENFSIADTSLHCITSLVSTDKGDFVIETDMYDNVDTISHITIMPTAEPFVTGTFSSIGSSNIGQILLLLVNLVEIGFIVMSFIDCFKNCKRSRILWLILIPLGRIAFAFKSGVTKGFSLSVFLGYTSYVTNAFGENNLTLVIPVAAIAWVFLKKRFIAPAKRNTPPTPVKKNKDLRK